MKNCRLLLVTRQGLLYERPLLGCDIRGLCIKRNMSEKWRLMITLQRYFSDTRLEWARNFSRLRSVLPKPYDVPLHPYLMQEKELSFFLFFRFLKMFHAAYAVIP